MDELLYFIIEKRGSTYYIRAFYSAKQNVPLNSTFDRARRKEETSKEKVFNKGGFYASIL